MLVKIAVCDDEIIMQNYLKDIILEQHKEYKVDIFNSGIELLENLNDYDVIFLDIDMPNKNGIEIGMELRNINYKNAIVFLTNHTEFMRDAFKVQAYRFLEKPVQIDELNEILLQIEKEIYNKTKIIIDSYGEDVLVAINEIIYIKSENKNSVFYLTNRTIDTNYPLKHWSERLNKWNFCKTHKSYIVSLQQVKTIEADRIILNNSDKWIPVSRRKYNTVKQEYFEYIKKNARII